MNKLFESGKIEFPPIPIMAEILLSARQELCKSEDDWTLDDMCKVRDMFPEEYRNIDPSVIGVRLRRLRKDKHVPKIKNSMSFVERAHKLLRDFEKNRERAGNSCQSSEYVEYINSELWRSKASEHKERVNWRCQFCDCPTSKLEIHHTKEGYRHLGHEKPWHILALCEYPCHPLADMLREGLLQKSEAEFCCGLFSEEEIDIVARDDK